MVTDDVEAFLVKKRERILLLRHQGKIHLVECREGGVDDTYLLGNVVVCSKEKVEEHCQKDDDQHEEIEGKQIWVRSLCIVHLKTVSHSVDGVNVRAGIRQFSADLLYQGIYSADIPFVIIAPDGIQDGFPRENHILIFAEMVDQVEFFGVRFRSFPSR